MTHRFGLPRDPDESEADRHRRLGRLGIHEDDLGYGDRYPNVDFGARDHLDPPGRVTAASVLATYGTGWSAQRHIGHSAVGAAVYEAYVPVSGMPDPELAEVEDAKQDLLNHQCSDDECGEEEDWSGERPGCPFRGVDEEDLGGYDWSEFSFGRKPFPPPKLFRDVHGKVSILDGNHRTEWWTGRGPQSYDYIPCWVIDEMKGVG